MNTRQKIAYVKYFFLRSECKTLRKQFFPCFQNLMISWDNLIKIGRAGGNTCTSKWEGPNEIGSVGMFVSWFLTQVSTEFKIYDVTVTKTSFKIASSGLLIVSVIMSVCSSAEPPANI